ASWVWKQPSTASPSRPSLRWSAIVAADELHTWESAWWPEPERAKPRSPIFPAVLLEIAAIRFLGGYLDDRLVAGCAVTSAEGVAGLSCAFIRHVDVRAARADLVSEVSRRYPDEALVGYEAGEELVALRRCGFDDVGPLRVWVRRQ